MEYDVVVAGGSIAGLLCARQIAARGHSVLVVEKGSEIGSPDHCGGLISVRGLDALGIAGAHKMERHAVSSARVSSAGGSSFEVDATACGIVELERRDLDRRAALDAQDRGAVICAKTEFKGASDGAARTSRGEHACRVIVDATGVTSMVMRRMRDGVLVSAQCEVAADWMEKGRIEVMLDQQKYPGFFAWTISSGDARGKVGVAGSRIDASRALDELLASRGPHSVLRRVSAPIWVGGPAAEFTAGSTVRVGDAAGQSKPTTAGGIYSCGMGGILAGDAIADHLESGGASPLAAYQERWGEMFGAEFSRQLAARRLLMRLDNAAIDELVGLVTPGAAASAASGDFDFHTVSLLRLVGVRGAIRAARLLPAAELARLVRA